MGVASALILIIVTLIFPPIGVLIVDGCGFQLLLNIILTLLGFFPGLIHAFYLEFVYYDQREKHRVGYPRARFGKYNTGPVGGISGGGGPGDCGSGGGGGGG
ncbi:putative plasma membrane proteolipid 3 [Erysiphe necator]|uniref:Putative plasma membrane proteolipid 3 n=1 Tax=Uncinula necator TaxID=52586 RepID=A0A0B1P285_UNCNE|nr:putative plasma membrane proteolipid 3 [Erysiphe necator]